MQVNNDTIVFNNMRPAKIIGRSMENRDDELDVGRMFIRVIGYSLGFSGCGKSRFAKSHHPGHLEYINRIFLLFSHPGGRETSAESRKRAISHFPPLYNHDSYTKSHPLLCTHIQIVICIQSARWYPAIYNQRGRTPPGADNQPGGTPGGSLYTPDRLPALVKRKTLHHAGIVVFFLTMDGIQRRNCTN